MVPMALHPSSSSVMVSSDLSNDYIIINLVVLYTELDTEHRSLLHGYTCDALAC
jgi:hypothetical protein